MRCISCDEGRVVRDAACKECYQELKAKLDFHTTKLDFLTTKLDFLTTTQPASFSDVLLFASDDGSKPIPAHKAVLVSRSPVLRAMLENEMEESLSCNICIGDVSYDTLCAFVSYLYTAEVSVDQQLACDLLILAEKYQVQHLEDYCQKFLVSNLNWDNSLLTYTFAHRHNAKHIIDAALTLITDNMDTITAREEYTKLKKNDPGLAFEIYEAYLSKQVAAKNYSSRRYSYDRDCAEGC